MQILPPIFIGEVAERSEVGGVIDFQFVMRKFEILRFAQNDIHFVTLSRAKGLVPNPPTNW